MRYKIKENIDNLRIIGEDFERNNRNKGEIIIKNKKYTLKNILLINNIKLNKIKMNISKNIFNKSCMFKECELLESISQLSMDKYKEALNYQGKKIVNENNPHIIESEEKNNLYYLNEI